MELKDYKTINKVFECNGCTEPCYVIITSVYPDVKPNVCIMDKERGRVKWE